VTLTAANGSYPSKLSLLSIVTLLVDLNTFCKSLKVISSNRFASHE